MHKTTFFAAAVLAAWSDGAIAQTHTATIGGAYIDLHSKAPPLSGAPVPNAEIEVKDSSTVILGYEYHWSDVWGVEAVVGIPPKHKTVGRGFLEPFGQISSMRQVAPTVFVNYHFGEVAPKLRPFVGAGINYTHFINGRSTASGDAAAGGPTSIKLKDSWGWAVHGGLTYALNQRWSIIGAISAAKVNSDVTATTTLPVGTNVTTTTIDFRPVVYSLSAGYNF